MARRQKYHTAHRGCLQGQGGTVKEAKADLDKQVDWACHYHPLHVETYFGRTIIIAPCAYGYSVMTIEPGGSDKVHSFRQFVGREPIEKEIKRQRLHVAQLEWSLYADDAQHLLEANLDNKGTMELAEWIKFQRLYTAHKAAGATDAQAHERACRGESPVKQEA